MANGYPVDILPKKEYELKFDIPLMVKAYPNLYVSRRIDGVKEDMIYPIDGDYVLLDNVYEGVKAANFSVNLLGGRFETEQHNHYRPLTDSFTKPWKGENISSEISQDMYELRHPCFAVYYKVNDFLKFPLTESITLNTEKEYQAFIAKEKAKGVEEKYLNAFKKGVTMIFHVNKQVNHMPTCCNYWHVTFDTYSFDAPQTPIISSGSRKSIERMLKYLRHEFLTMQAIIEMPEYDTISPYFYRKGICNTIRRKIITCANILVKWNTLAGPMC